MAFSLPFMLDSNSLEGEVVLISDTTTTSACMKVDLSWLEMQL
jgi:hypothetical protein